MRLNGRLNSARAAAATAMSTYLTALDKEKEQVTDVMQRLSGTTPVHRTAKPARRVKRTPTPITAEVLKVVPNKGEAKTASEIRAALIASGVKANSLSPTLSTLVEKGTIKRTGTSRAYRYYA